jgi:CheY-like chemotaxis protein
MSNDSVLIVDDEDFWRKIYAGDVRKLGIESIRCVDSLSEANQAIDSMKFAVAIVDIGLDKHDETNVDGLSVMAKLRSMDDDTGIIVITGRSGSDVIDVVSKSLQKYGATATFAKGKLSSGLLRTSVEDALSAYRQKAVKDRIPVYRALHSGGNQILWDDSMMRVLGIEGGVHVFYDFLEKLLKDYLPILHSQDDSPLGTELADGLAHAAFWSRAVGRAIVVSLGEHSAVDRATAEASSHGRLHGRYEVSGVLSEYAVGQSKGVVYALANRSRPDF